MVDLSIFDNDGTLGRQDGVRLFEFTWTGIGVARSDTSWRQAHEAFNQLFTRDFPKLLYSQPFTSYTPLGIGIGSQLMGFGETTLDDAQIRGVLIYLAESCLIYGNPSNLRVSSRSLAEIQSGQTLDVSPSTVNPMVTTDGVSKYFNGLYEDYKWPVLIGAVALALVITRR